MTLYPKNIYIFHIVPMHSVVQYMHTVKFIMCDFIRLL